MSKRYRPTERGPELRHLSADILREIGGYLPSPSTQARVASWWSTSPLATGCAKATKDGTACLRPESAELPRSCVRYCLGTACPRWLGALVTAHTAQAILDNGQRMSAIRFRGPESSRQSVSVGEWHSPTGNAVFERMTGETTWLASVHEWRQFIREVVLVPNEGKPKVEITLQGSRQAIPAVVLGASRGPRLTGHGMYGPLDNEAVRTGGIDDADLELEPGDVTALVCELARLFRAQTIRVSWDSIYKPERDWRMAFNARVKDQEGCRRDTEIVATTEIASENGDTVTLPAAWTWDQSLFGDITIPIPWDTHP